MKPFTLNTAAATTEYSEAHGTDALASQKTITCGALPSPSVCCLGGSAAFSRVARWVTPALAAVMILAAGCQTVSTSHTRDASRPRLAASDPARIQILRAEPTRPYVRLGEVRTESTDTTIDMAEFEKALRKEAGKLGADAVIIVSDKTEVPGNYVGAWRTRSAEAVPFRSITAVAVQFQ